MTTAYIDDQGVIVRISERDDATEGETSVALKQGEWREPGRWRWDGNGWEAYEHPLFPVAPAAAL